MRHAACYFMAVSLVCGGSTTLNFLLLYPIEHNSVVERELKSAVANYTEYFLNGTSRFATEMLSSPCTGSGERSAVLSFATDPAAANTTVVIGGCCTGGAECQNVLPQISYGPQRGSPSSFAMYPSLEMAHEAIVAFVSRNNWRLLLVITEDTDYYKTMTQQFLQKCSNSTFLIQLVQYSDNMSVFFTNQLLYDGVVWHANCRNLNGSSLLHAAVDIRLLLPAAAVNLAASDNCFPAGIEGFVFAEGIANTMSFNASTCGVSRAVSSISQLTNEEFQQCLAFDSVSLAIQTWETCGTNSSDFQHCLAQANFSGITGAVTFSEANNRKYNVSILMRNNSTVSVVGHFNGTTLAIDGDLLVGSSHGDMSNDPSDLTVMAVLMSFVALGMTYAVAILVFYFTRRKHRLMKLTSPNLNMITCVGCVMAYASLVPLALGRPMVEDLIVVAKLRQGGIFVLSAALTIAFGATLLKTWRIYRIFNQPQTSGKVITRDEHLLLMLGCLLAVDIVVHTTWIIADPYKCILMLEAMFPGSLDSTNNTVIVCSSEHSGAWYASIYAYKFALLSATAYCSFHTRHVTHPSLNDSSSIFANVGALVAMAMTTLPLAVQGNSGQIEVYASLHITAFLAITSSLCWLFIPKVMLLRRANQERIPSAIKFLAHQSWRSKSAGRLRLRRSLPRASEPNSGICNLMVSQELESLKQRLKEKDDSIRELTDRLFFGPGSFHSYVQRKTAPRSSIDLSVADSRSCSESSPPTSLDLRNLNEVFSTGATLNYRDYLDLDAAGGAGTIREENPIFKPSTETDERTASAPADLPTAHRARLASRTSAELRGTNVHLPVRRFAGTLGEASCMPFGQGLRSLSLEDEPSCITTDSGAYTASCSERGYDGGRKSMTTSTGSKPLYLRQNSTDAAQVATAAKRQAFTCSHVLVNTLSKQMHQEDGIATDV